MGDGLFICVDAMRCQAVFYLGIIDGQHSQFGRQLIKVTHVRTINDYLGWLRTAAMQFIDLPPADKIGAHSMIRHDA
jgi:hypothetical protein